VTDAEIMSTWRCFNPPPGDWRPILEFAHALLEGLPTAKLDGVDFSKIQIEENA
jgi:hypothetical protein